MMDDMQGNETASNAPQTLRDLLRTSSRDRHERLDHLFDGLDSEAEPALYRRFIVMNEACHRAIEPILGASPLADAFADWPSRQRAGVLARDVDAMRLAPALAPPFPIKAPDLAEAAGIAYVLEGSRLGARFFHRKLLDKAGKAGTAWAGASLHYLASAEGPDQFRPFMAWCDRTVISSSDKARATAAADATFDYFTIVGLMVSGVETADSRIEALSPETGA